MTVARSPGRGRGTVALVAVALIAGVDAVPARAAACHARIGFSAGWFWTSRAITSRGMTLPLTLMVLGFGSAFVSEQSMTYSAG
mgnify:CR=1 FL=1